MNPLLSAATERAVLREEHAQQLYLEAVQKAIQRGKQAETPATLPLDRLRDVVTRHGRESLLLHPDDLARLFAGVSRAVYHTAFDLYCSHTGRSIPMVWKLLAAMARQAQVPEPSYEAIWACCLSFERRRRDLLTAKIERGAATWWLGQLELPCTIRGDALPRVPLRAPMVWYVTESVTGQVLAYRIASAETGGEQRALVLFEALLAKRQPVSNPVIGLVWHLPQRLLTAIPLPTDCQKVCRALGITIEIQAEPPSFVPPLQDWTASLAGRVLFMAHCRLLCEAYLARQVSPSPSRVQEQRDRQYGHQLAYQRDASWQVPILRALLPSRQASVNAEGTLLFQGLPYWHPLLGYWPAASVTVRLSPASDALLWVYLEGEIVCQAFVRERHSQVERYQALHPGR